MSRKLVSLIQDNPRLSAKHKRTLECYAARANNDGTNIFASKETLGKKKSISRSTIYHNTPDLVRAGILVQAASHTCQVDACNKGATHYWGVQGKYTVVYNINLAALEKDETYLLLNRLKVPLPKQLNLPLPNLQKVGVSKLDTTQALRTTPAPLAQKDSSALTSGKEGRKEGNASLDRVEEEEQSEPEILVSEEQAAVSLVVANLWHGYTDTSFDKEDFEAADRLVDLVGFEEVLGYITDTFRCPRTSKIAWRNFSYWSDSLDPDAEPSTKRNIDAWRRTQKAKQQTEQPKNPNCAHCKGSTYGSPTWEEDKPYCADCMKMPRYRRMSGQSNMLGASAI